MEEKVIQLSDYLGKTFDPILRKGDVVRIETPGGGGWGEANGRKGGAEGEGEEATVQRVRPASTALGSTAVDF